ncbi:MAG: hypothetical protein ACIAQZ_00715 [Sedimentisphaeraceae bacterium JB056]
MRNPLFSITIITISFCFYAIADYDNAPLWEDQTAYTHQSWDFGDSGEYGTPDMVTDMSALPLGQYTDGEPNEFNNYGTPTLDAFYNSHFFMKGWMYVPEIAQTSRVAMYGGMGDTSVSFTVPGMQAGSDWIRQLWVQTIIYARKDGQQAGKIETARDSQFADKTGITEISETIEPLAEMEGYSAAWYRMTSVYEVTDSDQNDYIKVWAYFDPELPDPERLGASMIDRVDIDTRLILKADINRNGIVNYADFSTMAFHWSTNNDQTDLTNDGIINSDDLLYLSSMWLGTN